METPRPVSGVDREELEARNVQQLDQTFRYRAGVLSGHYGGDNNTDWFKCVVLTSPLIRMGCAFTVKAFTGGCLSRMTGASQSLQRAFLDSVRRGASRWFDQCGEQASTETPQGEVNFQLGTGIIAK